jgi:hypothetical protein
MKSGALGFGRGLRFTSHNPRCFKIFGTLWLTEKIWGSKTLLYLAITAGFSFTVIISNIIRIPQA